MSKINLDELNDMQYDVLKEIGNIGAGNATTALAQMVNMKVDMSVPKVELVPFSQLADFIGSEEEQVVGMFLQMSGDVDGMMMFFFNMRSAHNLVDMLMGRPITDDNDSDEFSEMDMSALSEIGNIISGAYLVALSKLTNLTIETSVPSMSIDMVGALLSVPAIEFGKLGDKLLFIQSQLGENGCINGYFLMIPELESYDKILGALGL